MSEYVPLEDRVEHLEERIARLTAALAALVPLLEGIETRTREMAVDSEAMSDRMDVLIANTRKAFGLAPERVTK